MGGTRVALNIEGSYLNGQILYFSVSDHGRSDTVVSLLGLLYRRLILCKSVYRWCGEVFYI